MLVTYRQDNAICFLCACVDCTACNRVLKNIIVIGFQLVNYVAREK